MFSGNLSSLQGSTNLWLLCDGSEVSRSTYQDLFKVIGVMYGSGNGIDTFNLPDFRYRFPLGSNNSNDRQLISGGDSSRMLTVSQLPPHTHTQGTLQTLVNGTHTHTYSDPGHNHGGSTGSARFSNGSSLMTSNSNGTASEFGSHQHTIATDFTNITIRSSGAHMHSITGVTSVTGGGQPFDIMPPYQTIHFIIRV
ncbi:unnamed protein product [Rotaria sp. Silwood1]|nr:unnamed protein product [Rotaria sp. Silwood1]CAF3709110.1 unnamed protein product [Rotaria sp. Silwood1]CAF3712119.1 unnamed protein product [Rotaria sp. Silwood1]CAF4668582.1 unnamed protein product [Rotaria sp. Silwood1]CAF4893115.1 unnamed protein product [Rotaria sp. Silwood1]